MIMLSLFCSLTLIFHQAYTVATLIIMKMINDSNNTHYVVHILTAQEHLHPGIQAHWKFGLILECFTAS